jgi:hypothetical protein
LAPELGDLAYHCRLHSIVLDQNPAMPKRGRLLPVQFYELLTQTAVWDS